MRPRCGWDDKTKLIGGCNHVWCCIVGLIWIYSESSEFGLCGAYTSVCNIHVLQLFQSLTLIFRRKFVADIWALIWHSSKIPQTWMSLWMGCWWRSTSSYVSLGYQHSIMPYLYNYIINILFVYTFVCICTYIYNILSHVAADLFYIYNSSGLKIGYFSKSMDFWTKNFPTFSRQFLQGSLSGAFHTLDLTGEGEVRHLASKNGVVLPWWLHFEWGTLW